MIDLTTREGVERRRKELNDNGSDQTYYDRNSLANAAGWYAWENIDIFPLAPGTKEPLPGSHGFHDASCNLTTVNKWWVATPNANIGAPTGKLFDILDVDGDKGFASLQRVLKAGLMPTTYGAVYTPTKGSVHFFIKPTGGGRKIEMLPGLDGLGLGGYAVLPPSWINGHGPYVWLQELDIDGLLRP